MKPLNLMTTTTTEDRRPLKGRHPEVMVSTKLGYQESIRKIDVKVKKIRKKFF